MSDIEPDTKDWTWVLERPCPDCGFVAADVERRELGALVRDDAAAWVRRLGAADVRTRPEPGVWSPLEYACHVRDVHRVFDERLRLMLEHDEPRFANWDQDETALAGDYPAQDPAVVAAELAAAADVVATTYDGVPDDAWQRRGVRTNGSEFTVDSIGRYHLHDLVHHAHDVGDGVRHTEFWERMDLALGRAYSRSWADQQVLTDLDGRTVLQALDDGESPKSVWRVVWAVLELPDSER